MGWFNDPVALFAKTTDEKMYYLSENIPFVTINDIYQERDHYLSKVAKGHPTHYEMFKDELYESVMVAVGYRKPLRRSLQEETTEEETTETDTTAEEDAPVAPASSAAADDEEEVLVDTGIVYEALYPAPYLTLQQV